MKRALILISLLYSFQVNAQDYLISFTGSGASNNIDTITVENLATGSKLTLKGIDILRLTGTVGISSPINDGSGDINVFPNPTKDYTIFEVTAPFDGEATITISDLAGKQLSQIRAYLKRSLNQFRLTGMDKGYNLITVRGAGYVLSVKVLSMGESSRNTRIEQIENAKGKEIHAEDKSPGTGSKGVQNFIYMIYNNGERLKFTGISGLYRSVVTDIPDASKTIIFDFFACSDKDENNYTTVEIGTQVWMAENLRTTKLNDGTSIPNVTDPLGWSSLTSPGYCWYDNNPSNRDIYGSLYNWYTVSSGQLCPQGWHHPSSSEWATLIAFLGGESVAGIHLKETGTIHWADPNNYSDNSSGFTALPAGYRYDSYFPFTSLGVFGRIYITTIFTASDEAAGGFAYWLSLSNSSGASVLRNSYPKNTGFSVRCMKDI